MTGPAAAPPLETDALWNLINRAERSTLTPQEARIVRRCVQTIIDRTQRAEAELAEWRTDAQHRAFTTCDQGLRHITSEAFARKIAEKHEALAQREQAVRDAQAFLGRARAAETELEQLRAERIGQGDPRQDAYDAAYSVIRTLPQWRLDQVERNAAILRAVDAALDAVGVPARQEEQ